MKEMRVNGLSSQMKEGRNDTLKMLKWDFSEEREEEETRSSSLIVILRRCLLLSGWITPLILTFILIKWGVLQILLAVLQTAFNSHCLLCFFQLFTPWLLFHLLLLHHFILRIKWMEIWRDLKIKVCHMLTGLITEVFLAPRIGLMQRWVKRLSCTAEGRMLDTKTLWMWC